MARKPNKTAAKAASRKPAKVVAKGATKRPARALTDGHAGRIADALEAIVAHMSANAPAMATADSLHAADAFVWHPDGRLSPVPKVSRVEIDLLKGIDRMRDILIENTERFSNGLPANNVLLWGARGMGKSSLVKAAHADVRKELGLGSKGESDLKLVEGAKPAANGTQLPPLRVQPQLVPGVLVVDIGVAQSLLRMPDQLSRLLVAKSANKSVNKRASLESIAGEQKLQVPADLDASHNSDLDKLKSASAPVDKPYAVMQKAAHADAVSLFEAYAKDGDNAALKSFASETLPTLKMHRDMIQKAETKAPANESTTPAVSTSGVNNPAAPVPGANSFTEDQAKSAIQKAGYTDVSALKKDDKGIWRGTASKDGKSTPVALDYQGNVVADTQ